MGEIREKDACNPNQGRRLCSRAYPLFRIPYTGGEVLRGADGLEPKGSEAYVDREREFPYKIGEGDLCLRLFRGRGYAWGGDWNRVKDYQHFQKIV